MAIIATEQGGVVDSPSAKSDRKIPTLSWQQVRAIRDRFAALKPYDRTIIPGSILKIDAENYQRETDIQIQLYCHSIAAKRYALLAGDRADLRKSLAHGLGYLLSPIDAE